MIAMSQQLQSDLCAAGTTDALQNRPPVPNLEILAVDVDEAPPEELEAEDDVKGGPLDPHDVKTAFQNEKGCLWDMEVYEYATEAEAREQDVTQLASSGSIPTKVALNIE